MPPRLLLFLLSLALAGCASPSSHSTAGDGSDSLSPPKPYMRVAHPDADTVSLEIGSNVTGSAPICKIWARSCDSC